MCTIRMNSLLEVELALTRVSDHLESLQVRLMDIQDSEHQEQDQRIMDASCKAAIRLVGM